jgi:hypothetical protein
MVDREGHLLVFGHFKNSSRYCFLGGATTRCLSFKDFQIGFALSTPPPASLWPPCHVRHDRMGLIRWRWGEVGEGEGVG